MAVIQTVQQKGDQETSWRHWNKARSEMKIDFILNDLHTLLDESADWRAAGAR
ncbi:MAG: hypothetical protein IPQ16_13560 [Geobacteraceae bacterium]|nr:hypothetical protein [Geobacteraceae bacterium]